MNRQEADRVVQQLEQIERFIRKRSPDFRVRAVITSWASDTYHVEITGYELKNKKTSKDLITRDWGLEMIGQRVFDVLGKLLNDGVMEARVEFTRSIE